MATVKDILAVKGSNVLTINPEATVLNAALLMNEHKVGSLLVLEQGKIVGVFTERDILQRIVAEQRPPSKTFVSEAMTVEVVCCTPQTSVEEARSAMKHRRIRHLPVVDDRGHLLGLISIGDLNAYQSTTQEQTIHLLTEYLYGRT